jgi:hypothetical protein
MTDGSLKTALQTEIDAMETAVQQLQVQPQQPAGAQAAAIQTDLTSATAVDAFLTAAVGT